MKKVTTASDKLAAKKTEWEKYTKANETLETTLDDPGANHTVGRYLCFIKGQWSKGLAHIAKGPESEIRKVAEMELARPRTAEQQLQVADGWKAHADQADELTKSALNKHAAKWYLAAEPRLEGLTKKRVGEYLKTEGLKEFGPKLFWITNSPKIDFTLKSATLGETRAITITTFAKVPQQSEQYPARLAIDARRKQIYVGLSIVNGLSPIMTCDFQGRNVSKFHQSEHCWGLRFNPLSDTLILGDHQNVLSISRDGKTKNKLSGGRCYYPTGAAIDEKAKKIFWLDDGASQNGYLESYDISTKTYRRIKSGIGKLVHSVCVDSARQRLYWGAEEPSKIYSGNYDGSDPKVIFAVADLPNAQAKKQPGSTFRDDHITDLLLDQPTGQLFYISRAGIFRLKPDGTQHERLYAPGGDSLQLWRDTE